MNDLDALSRTWPLTPESTVFVIGAYQGATIRQLVEKYDPMIYAFEPQIPMLAAIVSMGWPKVKLFNFGLGERDAILPMCNVGNDACSFVFPEGARFQTADGELRVINRFMEEEQLPDIIDLAVINIEGYELILLPHMIDTGIIKRFRHLMIQFHLGWELGLTYDSLRERIGHSHEVMWDYGPTWVAWRLK